MSNDDTQRPAALEIRHSSIRHSPSMSRTVLYLGILTGLVLLVGEYLGGQQGLQNALIFAALLNFAMYFWSDKIVLLMYRAKELPKEQSPEIHAMVEEIAKQAKIPKPRIYMTNMGIPNAFATGRNPEHAAVVVTDAIVELLEKEELKGVLAHELSHVLNRDVLVATIAATLAGALSMVARMAMFYGPMGRDGRDRDRGGGIGALLFLILTPLVATLIQLAVSRQREFGADESGAKLLGTGKPLASALQKLDRASKHLAISPTPSQAATAHLFIVNPFRASAIFRLFSTHPPTEERVKRLLHVASSV